MSSEHYRAIRHGAGLLDRSRRGRIVITGADRVDYLQGLLTNDVKALVPGTGCYSAYLTSKGRIISDLDLFNLGGTVLMDVHGEVRIMLVERFRELVFTEEVEIDDWTNTWTSMGLHGPMAPDVLEAAFGRLADPTGLARLRGLRPYGCVRLSTGVGAVVAARTDELGEWGFSLFVDKDGAADLTGALVAAGGIEVEQKTEKVIRVESGRPAFPEDMDEKTIPLEAGIEDRAISTSKGCYVGQEVIVRVLHRGQGRVARKIVGLTLEPTETDANADPRAPEYGAALLRGDDVVGHVTSAAYSPTLRKVIALGYVPRALAQPGSSVEVAFGKDQVEAVVTARPFVTSTLTDWRP